MIRAVTTEKAPSLVRREAYLSFVVAYPIRNPYRMSSPTLAVGGVQYMLTFALEGMTTKMGLEGKPSRITKN